MGSFRTLLHDEQKYLSGMFRRSLSSKSYPGILDGVNLAVNLILRNCKTKVAIDQTSPATVCFFLLFFIYKKVFTRLGAAIQISAATDLLKTELKRAAVVYRVNLIHIHMKRSRYGIVRPITAR